MITSSLFVWSDNMVEATFNDIMMESDDESEDDETVIVLGTGYCASLY